jgi:2,3-bisphosphoglycerate-independent phosphoglycerate mutase
MDPTKLVEELIEKSASKILLVVMDGLGDLPDAKTGRTPLEAARTPTFDSIAPRASMGLSHPIAPGITPGSGPAHMSLFGYDPVATRIGRGVLEALGVGMEMGPNHLAFRANFASKDAAGNITDRRAGRISTEKNEQLVAKLTAEMGDVEGCTIRLHSGIEHRFVVMLEGAGLSDKLTETDPQQTGVPALTVKAVEPPAARAAECANAFVKRLNKVLASERPANTCLLRGPAMHPKLTPIGERFGIKAGAIAAYPMYRGLAQLVGMDILDAGHSLEDEFACLERAWASHDFIYLHVKKTDSAGEDGSFDRKVAEIEHADALLPKALALKPDVMVVTCDHSTPCPLSAHSFHPGPFMMLGARAFPDGMPRFTERNCRTGYLGQFAAINAMPLMLGAAGRLAKFGA